MKSKLLLLGAMGAAAIVTASCGDNGGSASSTPPVTTPPASNVMALDTAQVLALAQVTSETSSPFMVNGGALVITDTSETTSPIAVAQ
jgi:hypothetical protein